jgi:multicomponent Na+:H+ antiporter subunit G
VSVAAIVLACVGIAFSLSGTVGILRMPDVYSRIQCSTKTVTMGALPFLLGAVLQGGVDTPFASRGVVVAVLLLIVSPLASHALARAAYRRGVPMWSGAVVDQAADRHDR